MKTTKKLTLFGFTLAGLALLALPQSGQAFELKEFWAIKGGIVYENNKVARFNNGHEVDIQVLDLPKTEKIEWKVTLNGQDQTVNFLGEEKDKSILGEEGRYLNFYVPYGYSGDIRVEAKSGNEVKTWSTKVMDDIYKGGKSSYYRLEEIKDQYTYLDTKWNYKTKTYTATLPETSNGKKVVAWRGTHDESLKLEKPGEITRPYSRSHFLEFYPIFETSSWLKSGPNWHYQKQGELIHNDWVNDKGIWYFMDSKGVMFNQTWLRQGENWYAFKDSGAMISQDWLYDQGRWYYLKKSGTMANQEWIYDQGKWYYLATTGTMANQEWIYDQGEWYFLTASGAMKSNDWIEDNGKWYYLNSSGEMLRNTWTPDGYYVGRTGAWE